MFVSKKSLLVVSALFMLIQSVCFADIMGSRFKIAESEEEFDVTYCVTPWMKIKEVEPNESLAVTQAFEISAGDLDAELYYTLFTDVGGDEDSLGLDYAMWVYICINNAAGYDVDLDSLSWYNDSDVQDEFNGDFGCTGTIPYPVSDYANGHNWMMTDFFYKHGQGLVMRSFLFDDLAFIGLTEDSFVPEKSLWMANFHTFEFMD